MKATDQKLQKIIHICLHVKTIADQASQKIIYICLHVKATDQKLQK